MKKSFTLFALALSLSSSFAQELKSKKEEPFLPEEGDWGLAIDATPFLNYAGNFFGKTTANTAPTFNFFTNAQTITGKYFTDAKTAFRGSLRIGMGSATERTKVTNIVAPQPVYPAATAVTDNVWKQSNTTLGLAAGIEMRKGKTRLQGYYGGEIGIYLNTSKDKFTYGNKLAATNIPSLNVNVTAADNFTATNNFGNTGNNVSSSEPINGIIGSARALERKNGSMFSFGLRGFIGAEYFVLPKLSIGGEFGWGIGMTSIGKSTTTWESVGNTGFVGAPNQVGQTQLETSKRSGFALDTDNINSVWGPMGTLRLNLYF